MTAQLSFEGSARVTDGSMYLENVPGGKILRMLGWQRGGVEKTGPKGAKKNIGMGNQTCESWSSVAMVCGQDGPHTAWAQQPVELRSRLGRSRLGRL